MTKDDITRTYELDDLVIIWKKDYCEHACECVRGLPEVFNMTRRPWIVPKNTTKEEIMEVIDRYPTEALTYKLKDK